MWFCKKCFLTKQDGRRKSLEVSEDEFKNVVDKFIDEVIKKLKTRLVSKYYN